MSNYLSYCSKCLVEKPQYDQLITCVKYSGDVKRMILWYKFYDRPDFCDSFALMIYNRLIESHCTDVDVIIPIPLSKKRLSDRGYNQSELIAQRLSELLNIPCETDVLLKIKDTKTQSTLPKNKRESNIHGAFKLYNKDKIYNKSILIVDDVVTTGATMREAARLISKSAYKINCCAIAKNVFNKSKNKSG